LIEVRAGDIEQALLLFRREVVKDGIHAALKRREQNANLTDRKKVKERVAKQRRIKAEAKKRQQEVIAELRRWGERKRPVRRRGRA